MLSCCCGTNSSQQEAYDWDSTLLFSKQWKRMNFIKWKNDVCAQVGWFYCLCCHYNIRIQVLIVSAVIATFEFKVLLFLLHYNIWIQGFIVATVITTFGFKVLLFLPSLQHLDSRFYCFYCHYNIWIKSFNAWKKYYFTINYEYLNYFKIYKVLYLNLG